MKKKTLMNNYYVILSRKNYSVQTQKCYLHYFQLFLDFSVHTQSRNFDSQLFNNFLTNCKTERKFSYSSMKQAFASVKLFYSAVLNMDTILMDIYKIRIRDNPPEILSLELIQLLVTSIHNLKHRAIISTIYACGLRLAEIVNLRICDISYEQMTIRIVDSKTGKERAVNLSTRLSVLLKNYTSIYKPVYFLFEGASGNHYSPRSVQAVFKKALKNMDIPKKITLRTLRHSFAAHLLENGTDIRIVRNILGHKNLSSTQIYSFIVFPSVLNITNPFDKKV